MKADNRKEHENPRPLTKQKKKNFPKSERDENTWGWMKILVRF